MDPAKAKALIEESGWTLGSDGIYEKDGQKLSTITAVRAERPDRSRMQLLADQVRECGMDIQYKEVDFAALLNMLDVYPHINAAPEAKPFDTYFGGFGTSFDPDPYALYHSTQCSTAEQPGTFNYICYRTPRPTSSSRMAWRPSTRPSVLPSTRSTRSCSPRTCRSSTPGPTSPARVSVLSRHGRRARSSPTAPRGSGQTRS